MPLYYTIQCSLTTCCFNGTALTLGFLATWQDCGTTLSWMDQELDLSNILLASDRSYLACYGGQWDKLALSPKASTWVKFQTSPSTTGPVFECVNGGKANSRSCHLQLKTARLEHACGRAPLHSPQRGCIWVPVQNLYLSGN